MKRAGVCIGSILAMMIHVQAVGESSSPAIANPVRMAGDAFVELETFRLWPARAPGATSDTPAETPTITIFRPQKGFSNGAAVVVAPGGAYIGLAGNLEGRQVGDWFASRGITAFVLKYRVGPLARLPIPLSDGARAMRFARAYARLFQIDPGRIGMIGFSAGGHLSALTAGLATAGDAAAPDPVERVSSRPDFLVLGYPWLEGMIIDKKTGTSQYCAFAKGSCEAPQFERYAAISNLSASMPPTFIYHTTDDPLVPVDGSVRYFQALEARGVPVEMHLFASGPHGTGLGGSDPSLAKWPELLEAWLRRLHILGSGRQSGVTDPQSHASSPH